MGWFTHDPVDSGAHARAASEFFGQSVTPTFRFDRADVIVSLDGKPVGHHTVDVAAAGADGSDGSRRRGLSPLSAWRRRAVSPQFLTMYGMIHCTLQCSYNIFKQTHRGAQNQINQLGKQ